MGMLKRQKNKFRPFYREILNKLIDNEDDINKLFKKNIRNNKTKKIQYKNKKTKKSQNMIRVIKFTKKNKE